MFRFARKSLKNLSLSHESTSYPATAAEERKKTCGNTNHNNAAVNISQNYYAYQARQDNHQLNLAVALFAGGDCREI